MPRVARPTSPIPTSPRALGYVRVSTDKQADRGISLEAQMERIRAMAIVQGVDLVDVIVDAGESAATLERPGLAQLLARVDAREVETVIVTKLDRLTRSVRDLGDLLERFARRHVSLVSVTESLDTGSAAGRLVLNIMVSVSAWEREIIGERTAEALRHKRARGQRAGTVPFGFSVAADGRTLVPEETEQQALAVMRECRAAGYTLRAIAQELNRQGLSTRRGTPWRHEYVYGLLAPAA